MRKIALGLGVLVAGLMLVAVMLGASPVRTETPQRMAGAIKGPDDYTRAPADVPIRAQTAVTATYGVAIVGDVDSSTQNFIDDMEGAVAELRDNGVKVTTFYYGQDTFSWTDIVSATNGANFLLYSGHGIYWSGSCTSPDLVGGFYLGPDDGNGNFGFVRPDTVRDDLSGRMADQSVALLTHVCFSAGSSACDSSTTPDLAEASRRVTMYASSFIDAGFNAYYANNFYNSLANYVNYILYDYANRPTYAETYATYYPFSTTNLYSVGYDADDALYLNGSPGNWDGAFAGKANERFTADQYTAPELGHLPDRMLAFYDQTLGQWATEELVLYLQNVTTSDQLTVTVETNAPYLSSPATYSVYPSPNPVALPLRNILVADDSAVMTLTVEATGSPMLEQHMIPLAFVVAPNVTTVYLPVTAK